jgi:Dolichyl-phosphate-mannose-protein mannosyltransferase
MGAASDTAGPEAGLGLPGAAGQRPTARSRLAGWLEALAVALSPLAAALVLRLRPMAPSVLDDPSLHTAFIVHPRDVFTRYAAAYAATAKMREGARVGFLVPARLDYLAFGAVPGFFVTRYVFALVAVVPVYMLLRRLYGRAAGVAGILVVLSSPVIVTAWGTDYPDSAVVSYAAGALACLAMPSAPRWRRWWLAAAGTLLTLAVWSHGIAVPLVAATLAGYLGVRLARDRAGLAGDLAVLAAVAAAVTGLLAVASAVLLGNANFIGLTWQGIHYLSGQAALNHSSNWRWAPFVSYLLVPPAVLAAFVVAVSRRGRAVPTPVVVTGVVAVAQLAVYAGLQFAGSVQSLEQHYFSSTLWAGVCLAFAVTVAELARPLWGRPVARWLPAAVLLAVPLGYEAGPRLLPHGWLPWGVILAAAMVVAAAAARGAARLRGRVAGAAVTGLALAAFASAALALTVTPIPVHPQLPGTVSDPAPAYASALGGSGTLYIDTYRVAAALPGFVGPATYRGEQLLIWQLTPHHVWYIYYAVGMYHAGFNRWRSRSPVLSASARSEIEDRRPAELLLLGQTAAPFPAALRQLHGFRPKLMRAGELRSGPLVLHVWLLRLGVYTHPPSGG